MLLIRRIDIGGADLGEEDSMKERIDLRYYHRTSGDSIFTMPFRREVILEREQYQGKGTLRIELEYSSLDIERDCFIKIFTGNSMAVNS